VSTQQRGINTTKRKGKMTEEINEVKSSYEKEIKAFLAKGGEIQKGDKPDKKKIEKVTKSFLKSFKKAKNKEAELDAKDKAELEKMMGEEIARENEDLARQMNLYFNTLSKERSAALWSEAKVGEDPEPVSGKKTFTKKPQAKVTINPEEKV